MKKAEPILAHILAQFLDGMHLRAQLSLSVLEIISITRDVALFALAVPPCAGEKTLSFTLGSEVLRLPDGKGFILYFHLVDTGGRLPNPSWFWLIRTTTRLAPSGPRHCGRVHNGLELGFGSFVFCS